MYTFLPNTSFAKLLAKLATNFKFLKTFNSGFSYIKVWFTKRNSTSLELENRTNLKLWWLNNTSIKNDIFNLPKDRIFVKCYGLLSFAKI